MKRRTIHIESWWKEHNDRLSDFQLYWEYQNQQDPKNFPLNLGAGDWDEQFSIFCEQVYQPEVDKKGFFSPLDYRKTK
jgi:hypothetical protein